MVRYHRTFYKGEIKRFILYFSILTCTKKLNTGSGATQVYVGESVESEFDLNIVNPLVIQTVILDLRRDRCYPISSNGNITPPNQRELHGLHREKFQSRFPQSMNKPETRRLTHTKRNRSHEGYRAPFFTPKSNKEIFSCIHT